MASQSDSVNKWSTVSVELNGDRFAPASEDECRDLLMHLSSIHGEPSLARIRSSNGTMTIGLRHRSGQSVVLHLAADGQPFYGALPLTSKAGEAIYFDVDGVRYEFDRVNTVKLAHAIEVAVRFASSGILSAELVWRPEGEAVLT